MSWSTTKPTKWPVHPAKTRIGLGGWPVWSESSLATWRRFGSLATHKADRKDSHQTGWIPSLSSFHWMHRLSCSGSLISFVFKSNIWAAAWQNYQNDVRPAKTQISLGIHWVWSESLLLSLMGFFMWTAKTLIRLGGCQGWSAKPLIRLGRCPGCSESWMGAHVILLVLICAFVVLIWHNNVAHISPFYFSRYVSKQLCFLNIW